MITGGKLRRVALAALSPIEMDQVGQNSVDVRLASKFLVPEPSETVLDLSDTETPLEAIYKEVFVKELVLPPGGFVCGYMFESVHMPEGVTAMFSLRSVMARRGLQQAVSVWIREGWHGELVLELSNDLPRPILLKGGMMIGQLHFFTVQQ